MLRPRVAPLCGLCGDEGARAYSTPDGEGRVACPRCAELWRWIDGHRPPHAWLPVPEAIRRRCGR